MPSSRDLLQSCENELTSVQQQRESTSLQISEFKKDIRLKWNAKAEKKRALQEKIKLVQKLQEDGQKARAALESSRSVREALASEYESCKQVLSEERTVLDAHSDVDRGLAGACTLLAAVRQELEALAGEAAKMAAVEAAGGDLPADAVPVATRQAEQCSMDWQGNPKDAQGHQATFRRATQSQAVIVAAQRSLVVKATEIREGLREWGFTRSAVASMEAVREQLVSSQGNDTSRTKEVLEDRERLESEMEEARRGSSALGADLEALRGRHAGLLARQRELEGCLGELQAGRDASTQRVDEATSRRQQLTAESANAEKEVDATNLAMGEHDVEAERRRTASQALARRAAEQVEKGFADLGQTQRQLVSFQQAHAVLKQVHEATLKQLEWEKESKINLRFEHDMLNLSLEALARNYMEALPKIPGVEDTELAKSPAVATPVAGLQPSEARSPEIPLEDPNEEVVVTSPQQQQQLGSWAIHSATPQPIVVGNAAKSKGVISNVRLMMTL